MLIPFCSCAIIAYEPPEPLPNRLMAELSPSEPLLHAELPLRDIAEFPPEMGAFLAGFAHEGLPVNYRSSEPEHERGGPGPIPMNAGPSVERSTHSPAG